MNNKILGVEKKPHTTKSREPLSSPMNYKYKFPQSERCIRSNGGFGVEDASKFLLDFYWRFRVCVHIVAGALMRIEHFELKIELSHYLYQFSDSASKIRTRLKELRVSDKKLDFSKPSYLNIIENELLILEDSIEFTLSLYNVMVLNLITDIQKYCATTHNLLDQPSVRILEAILFDLDKMEKWFIDINNASIKAGDDVNTFMSSIERINDIYKKLSLGETCNYSKKLYKRSHECARDPRFSIYHYTRKNNIADIKKNYRDISELDAEKLELFWVQRDELDAIETFANIIYDLKYSFELECFLARLVWDEARHSEMGQQNIRRLGYDPFDVPCGVIGINVRSPLSSIVAFAQINIFGELNQLKHLKKTAEKCYISGDNVSAHSFDFTHSDELMHVRKGRDWLKILSQNICTDIKGLELLAKEQSISRLVEEGVLNEDYANEVTSDDLGKLIGE